jgi:two-component system cell cycle sensor histidine kinase/response regulator CckA
VESAAGVGTTFTIVLPVAKALPPELVPQPARPAARPQPRPDDKQRILLVEDDDGVRDFAAEVLVRAGFQVDKARHGVEGLSVAESRGNAIDLVVTDVVMPEMGGRQMVKQLRTIRPDLRVLYISGYADDAVARQELGAGQETLRRRYRRAQPVAGRSDASPDSTAQRRRLSIVILSRAKNLLCSDPWLSRS